MKMSAPKSEVRVYEAQKPLRECKGLYNTDFSEPVILKKDYDQEVQALKAEIDRLNNKYDFQLLVKSNEALKEEIASMNDSNFKLYNQTEEQFKIIQDQKKEIEVLEARLKKCQSQRDEYIFDENSKANLTDLMGEQIRADNELSAITIDSIKRGE